MQKTLITIFVVLIVNNFQAQTNKVSDQKLIDSLTQVVSTSKIDSTYLQGLSSLVKIYSKNNSDTAITLIDQGILESKKRKNLKYEGQFLAYKGSYYRTKKELDSSIFYYELSLVKLLAYPDSSGYMGTKVNLANALKVQGKYEEAVINFISAIKYFESFSDDKNQKNAVISKFNLASMYIPLKEYEKGAEINLEIVNHPFAKSNKMIYSKTCINLVGFLSALGREDEALYYASEAEKTTTNKQSLANLYTNIGTIYDKKKEYTKSIEYHTKALENYKVSQSSSGMVKSFNNLGNASIMIKQFAKAEDYLFKAKDIMLQEKNLDILSVTTNYRCFVNLYEQKGEYKKAYENSKILTQLNDSILGLDTKKALLEVETKYETEKNKKEKALAEANELISFEKAENSKLRSIGALIFAGVTAILLFFIFNKLKVIRKQKKELDKAYEILEESKRFELAASNLKALKSQMNPHFIFNSLNSIQDLILKEDTDASYDYIVIFAELVRNTLTYSNNEFIPFHKEIDFLSVYLKLEQLRFGDEFKFEIITNGIEDIKVPSLIIQPFLENSLKHGLLHKDGLKELTLEFKLDKELTCVITDNGVGRLESARIQERRGNKTHESFAMSAIKERLDLLSDQFEKEFRFEVEDLYENDLPTGTRIRVVIPFEERF